MKKMSLVVFLLGSLALGVCIGVAIKHLTHKTVGMQEPTSQGALPKFRGFTVRLAEGASAEECGAAFEAMRKAHATAVLVVVDNAKDANLGAVVKEAHARKLQVFLAQAAAKEAEAPTAAAYAEQMRALAGMAKSLQVYGMCVGLGVDSSIGDGAYWKGLLGSLRGVAPSVKYMFVCGPDDYPMVGWWDAADIIGVGNGFELTGKEDADVNDFRNSWRTHVEELCSFASLLGRSAMLVDIQPDEQFSPQLRSAELQALLLESKDRPELAGVLLGGWTVRGGKGAGLQSLAGVVAEEWTAPGKGKVAASAPLP